MKIEIVSELPKGKNFSRNNTGKRKESDLYETPYSLTIQLLEKEIFPNRILEPACGNGAISGILRRYGKTVVAYDLENGRGLDFLKEKRKFPAIITNPPYGNGRLANAFMVHAKKVAIEKFAFLLPLTYLQGQTRFDDIWSDRDFPLARVWTFIRYPMLGNKLRDDGRYITGMQTYAWFVWDRLHQGPFQGGWIDNRKFVLPSSEK